MIELRINPTKKELRWFGVLFLVFAGVLGLILWGKAVWLFGATTMTVPLVVWGIGAGVAILYYAVPPLRRPLFAGWMYLAFPIGWVVSNLVLAAVYYLVLTPIGLVMRLLGKDPMTRRIDREATSYWIERPGETEPGRYFRQF